MVFTYTEKELREFNIGDNVYSVNPDYAEKNHSTVITDLPQKDNETNIRLPAKQNMVQ
ncbi:hypothetical protein V2T84_07425 [Streptococcus agalactiae]